jgi:hypothetical protein
MRMIATPLLLLLVHWITVCVCLQGFPHSYAWTTPHQGQIPERLQFAGGSRDPLTRLALGSGGGYDNDKDEATMQQQQPQQPSSPE